MKTDLEMERRAGCWGSRNSVRFQRLGARVFVAALVGVLVIGGCSESDSGGRTDKLPPGSGADTKWVNGWSCDGLDETFISGDPAADPLHDWTQADVAAAQAEYAERC
jgi:hypothetical protein